MKTCKLFPLAALVLGFSLILPAAAHPQTATCVVIGSGDNQNRKALAPVWEPGVGWHHIIAECHFPHTPPWGMWGVASNVGQKLSHGQFEGWGPMWEEIKRQWNSCTRDWPPNPASELTYYNCTWDSTLETFTQQCTIHGINNNGSVTDWYGVECPRQNSAGAYVRGGCSDLNGSGVTVGQNFMSVYEMDRPDGDDLIQTMYFPNLSVTFSCDVFSCAPVRSAWVSPNAYDDPVWPAVIDAKISILVEGGMSYGDCSNYVCPPCDPDNCPPCELACGQWPECQPCPPGMIPPDPRCPTNPP